MLKFKRKFQCLKVKFNCWWEHFFFSFWWQQTKCFQCEAWHRFCFKISNSWFVCDNNCDIQSNNQVALILQFSCMQPFHLPSTDVVLTWPWLLPYAKFGSESWTQRLLICFLQVKFPHMFCLGHLPTDCWW